MKTDYIRKEELMHILAALTPPNRLALELSLATGLRISDVLALRTDALINASERRISVRELKTGKYRRVKLPAELYDRAVSMAGKIFVFPNRIDYRRSRTRQAVFKDLKRASALFRIKGPHSPNVAPHSARKVYAVEQFQRSKDLKKVQKLLNHSDEAVTILYAMADQLTARKIGKR